MFGDDRAGRAATVLGTLLLLSTTAACTSSSPQVKDPVTIQTGAVIIPLTPSGRDASRGPTPTRRGGEPDYEEVPPGQPPSSRPPSGEQAPSLQGEPVSVSVPKLPIPQFISTVAGELLNLNYVMLGKVNERTELISLQTQQNTTRQKFFNDFVAALVQFGISVSYEQGQYKFFEQASSDQIPEFIRGRSNEGTPDSMRPITQIVTLVSIDANVALELLNQMLGTTQTVKITASQSTNSLIVTGLPGKVAQVVDLIGAVDQSNFAGSQAATVTPIYWSPNNLATALAQVLTSEGYNVSTNPALRRAIMLVPVQYTNQLVVFAEDAKLLQRVMTWWRKLDRPEVVGDSPTVFIYQVQNTNARQIADVLNSVRPGLAPAVQPSAPAATADGTVAATGTAPTQPVSAPPQASGAGALVVDDSVNRLLFNGTPAEYQRLLPLIEQLDTPPREVYIEVAIAEVTLTDETKFGVEWQFDNLDLGANVTGSIGTAGGLGLTTDGIVAKIVGLNSVATLSALAKNQAVNLLSRPRLVARSGTEARIQVGTDVPIITSQRASDVQDTGDTDILQQVQYRQTGVVLGIKPVILGDGRIDVEVSQEVSEAQSNPNQSIASPIILNRHIGTTLSLRDGTTAVIGGLMQNNTNTGEQGVPLLKDVPVLGGLFRTNTVESRKTELLVLITPYILDNPRETEMLAGELQRRINNALYESAYKADSIIPASVSFDRKPPPVVEAVVPAPARSPEPAARGLNYPRTIDYECADSQSFRATFKTADAIDIAWGDLRLAFVRNPDPAKVDEFIAGDGYAFNYASTAASLRRNGSIVLQGCGPI